jgi:hypothetical protein
MQVSGQVPAAAKQPSAPTEYIAVGDPNPVLQALDRILMRLQRTQPVYRTKFGQNLSHSGDDMLLGNRPKRLQE